MEVRIKKLTDNADSSICYMPSDIFDTLKLLKGILYRIHLGQSYEYTYINPNKESRKCMYFSNTVFKKLLLPEGTTLNIWRNGDEIYLGPVVGIFVNPKSTEAIENGAPSFSTQKHGEAGSAANCLSYYFSIEEMNWEEGKLKGYTFDRGSNKWRQDWFPMPDVIYDRGVNFNKNQIPIVRHMMQQFRAGNIHFINSQRFLDKWEVHECLSKYPEIKAYLPRTIIYESFDDVLSMLNEFKFIFVKASGGTQGTDVLSIEQTDSGYILNFYEDELKEVVFEKIEDVKEFVEEYATGRFYIVQQGIRLIKYDGRNMDVRLLMMKDIHGRWNACEQHHCRVAQKTYTITNCSLGGDWIDYDEAYPHLSSPFLKRSIPDKQELVNSARKILYYYEKEFGPSGEIGVDMAVDMYGHIWFIESNTGPDKLSMPDLYDPKKIPVQAINIFEYARFLAGASS